MKHSGALMSSRLMPPNVGSSALTIRTTSSIRRVQLEVEHVDVGEPLEERRLPFHHRFGPERTDVPEAEHCGAVAHDGDEVASARESGMRGIRIVRDRQARARDPGVYGSDRSRWVKQGFDVTTSSFLVAVSRGIRKRPRRG